MFYQPIGEDQRREYLEELRDQSMCPKVDKDILIVVRNGLPHVHACLTSVFKWTKQFTLYLWDNDSDKETRNYLLEMCKQFDNVIYMRSEKNLGFIVPNNILVSRGTAPFVILVNSDTEVNRGWADALIGILSARAKYGVVGYQGGLLGPDGFGIGVSRGSKIDYVAGWCMAFRRSLYEEIGLFDAENLQMAYGEDSDFCLRAREVGKLPYALLLQYAVHFGGATAKKEDLGSFVTANHKYLKKRWSKYLSEDRVLLGEKNAKDSVDEVAVVSG